MSTHTLGKPRAQFETFAEDTARRPLDRDYQVGRPELVVFPYRPVHAPSKEPAVISAGLVFLTAKRKDPSHVHTVTIACISGEGKDLAYSAWCGDAGFTGKLPHQDYVSHVQAAVGKVAAPGDGALTGHQERLSDRMLSTYGMHPANAPCSFWKRFIKDGVPCKHVSNVFSHLLGIEGGAVRGNLRLDRVLDVLSEECESGRLRH